MANILKWNRLQSIPINADSCIGQLFLFLLLLKYCLSAWHLSGTKALCDLCSDLIKLFIISYNCQAFFFFLSLSPSPSLSLSLTHTHTDIHTYMHVFFFKVLSKCHIFLEIFPGLQSQDQVPSVLCFPKTCTLILFFCNYSYIYLLAL